MMKSRLLKLFICILVVFMFSACQKQVEPSGNNDSQGCDIVDDCGDNTNSTLGLTFKEAYELLNGQTNSSGKPYRVINIAEDNPFVEVSATDVIKMIENKETFYLYVGDEMCPWCRSVIEKAIEVSKQANVDKIYYIQIWDDDHNEVLRDQYVLEEGKLVQKVETSEEYKKLLEYFDNVLSDYTLTDDGNSVEVGEKRIYAPNFFYAENGNTLRFTTGTSDKQEDARQELSDEIIVDEIDMFEEFFGVKQ